MKKVIIGLIVALLLLAPVRMSNQQIEVADAAAGGKTSPATTV